MHLSVMSGFNYTHDFVFFYFFIFLFFLFLRCSFLRYFLPKSSLLSSFLYIMYVFLSWDLSVSKIICQFVSINDENTNDDENVKLMNKSDNENDKNRCVDNDKCNHYFHSSCNMLLKRSDHWRKSRTHLLLKAKLETTW